MVDIKTNIENGIYEIEVHGEVDASSSIHLDNALNDAFEEAKHIAINLSGLIYISSAGLGVFISRLEEIREKGLKMVLFGLNDKVLEVFNILGLGDLLDIHSDRNTALGALNEA